MKSQEKNPRPKRLGFWKLNFDEYLKEKVWRKKLKVWRVIVKKQEEKREKKRLTKIID